MKEFKIDPIPEPRELKDLPIKYMAKGSYFFLRKAGEPGELGYVGVEFEQRWSCGTTHMRAIKNHLLSEMKRLEKEKSGVMSLIGVHEKTMLRDNIRSAGHLVNLLPNLALKPQTPLIHGTPHTDGGGHECVLYPATLKAHQALKSEYERLIRAFQQYGYNDIQGGDGIHTNIDYSLFGKDHVGAIERFLWFLFYNSDFMVSLSERKYNMQYRADMASQLGDEMRNWSDSDYLNSFKKAKGGIVQSLRQSTSSGLFGRPLNFSVGRDGRRCLEWRWFGSTQDINKFMSIIELSFALPAFSGAQKTEDAMTLPAFCSYVRENMETYPHLFQVMVENEYSREYMFHSIEQIREDLEGFLMSEAEERVQEALELPSKESNVIKRVKIF